jgi:hypothetical protein
VTISTYNGCAFLGVSWSDETDLFKAQCRAYVDGTLQRLRGAPRGLVVIGFSDSLWVAPHIAVGPTRATETADEAAKARYLQAQLRTAVGGLRRAGQAVLLMQPVPKLERLDGDVLRVPYDPEHCTTISVIRGTCPRPLLTPRAYADRIQAQPRRTIRQVAAVTGAHVLDLRSFFCSRGICSSHHDGIPLYRDGGHITVRTSSELAGRFAEAMRRLPTPATRER